MPPCTGGHVRREAAKRKSLTVKPVPGSKVEDGNIYVALNQKRVKVREGRSRRKLLYSCTTRRRSLRRVLLVVRQNPDPLAYIT